MPSPPPTPRTLVAVGAGGTIVTTADGSGWAARTSGTTSDLLGAAYGDAAYVWASGAGGIVLRSVNRGVQWATQRTGSIASSPPWRSPTRVAASWPAKPARSSPPPAAASSTPPRP